MATHNVNSGLFADIVPNSAAIDAHTHVTPAFAADTTSEGSLLLPSSESSGISSGPSSVASDSDDGKSVTVHCPDAALSLSSRMRRRSRKPATRLQDQPYHHHQEHQHQHQSMAKDRAAIIDYQVDAQHEHIMINASDAQLGTTESACLVSPSSGEATAPQGTARKKRVAHTKEAITLLKDWLLSEEHVHNPYPTETEKKELMRLTGLDKKQLTNWFTNARKRIWQPRYGPTPKSKKGDDYDDGGHSGTNGGGRSISLAGGNLHPAAVAEPASPASPTAMPGSRIVTVPVLDPVHKQERAMGAAAAVAPELVTPQQRKRNRNPAPSLEPMELDAVEPLVGSAARSDPSPRAPKTPRLEHEYVLSHAHAHSLPTIAAVSRATPEAEVHLSDMNIFDFQETQRFGDQMIHPLSPVNGFDDTLGSPVECVWLESSH